jgi:hypothetical protein
MPAKFLLGRIVATPSSLEALSQTNQDAALFLSRHQHGNWGDLCEEDNKENEFSVLNGFRILSAYALNTRVPIWIITEADRSATTILLPEDY